MPRPRPVPRSTVSASSTRGDARTRRHRSRRLLPYPPATTPDSPGSYIRRHEMDIPEGTPQARGARLAGRRARSARRSWGRRHRHAARAGILPLPVAHFRAGRFCRRRDRSVPSRGDGNSYAGRAAPRADMAHARGSGPKVSGRRARATTHAGTSAGTAGGGRRAPEAATDVAQVCRRRDDAVNLTRASC
jgi:hypothetical protein